MGFQAVVFTCSNLNPFYRNQLQELSKAFFLFIARTTNLGNTADHHLEEGGFAVSAKPILRYGGKEVKLAACDPLPG